MKLFSKSAIRAFAGAGVIAMMLGAFSHAKEKAPAPSVTYRTYPQAYNTVWNAAVRLIVEDLKYLPEVADPQVGFLSTRWKPIQGKANQNQKRLRLHLNIKKAASGTLVTVRCEFQEFIPIPGTDKGRWKENPSDNTCEARFLDQLAGKLK